MCSPHRNPYIFRHGNAKCYLTIPNKYNFVNRNTFQHDVSKTLLANEC